jgi:hypothetical protein
MSLRKYIEDINDFNYWNKTYDVPDSEETMNRFDFVYEMLKSQTPKNLLNRIWKQSHSIGQIVSDDGNVWYLLIRKADWESNETEIRQSIDAAQWYISRQYRDFVTYKNYQYKKLLVEPVYTKIVTDHVYNDCNGTVYHVTNRKNAVSIERNGIRLKGNRNTYRFFENRIYFVTSLDLVEQIKKDRGLSDVVVFKCDLKKHNYKIDFYRDTTYDSDDFVYTYACFPPQFIEKVE